MRRGIVQFGFVCLLLAQQSFAASSSSTVNQVASIKDVALAQELSQQADAAFFEGKYKDAAHLYFKSMELVPENANYADGLGKAYSRMSETSIWPSRLMKKARFAFHRAVRLNPYHREALQDLVTATLDTGHGCVASFQQAEVLIHRIEKIDINAGLTARANLDDARKTSKEVEQIVRCGFKPERKSTGQELAELRP